MRHPATAPGPEDDNRVNDRAQDGAVDQLAYKVSAFGHGACGNGRSGAGEGKLEEEIDKERAVAFSCAGGAAQEELDLGEETAAFRAAKSNTIAHNEEDDASDTGVHEVFGERVHHPGLADHTAFQHGETGLHEED